MVNVLDCLPYTSWSPSSKEHPLPSHIQRSFVSTPNGNLELLICAPKHTSSKATPLIFIHGGFGSASVWIDWMSYLYEYDYNGTIYAYSARGHGASYPVSFYPMVYCTTLDDFASDLATTVHHITSQLEDGKEPILVAHSAGGALVQYALANRMVSGSALCLVGSIPHFGGYDAFWNWTKMDPWMHARSLPLGFHPKCALVHPQLVHRALFSDKYPIEKVKEFMTWMAPYESFGWATGVNGSFWKWLTGKNEWLDPLKILKSVNGWERPGDRVCVMVGSHDVPMDLKVARRQAGEFREVARAMEFQASAEQERETREEDIPGVDSESMERVRLVIVQGAGHHVQNDIQQAAGAEALRRWIEQL
ncbi:hypothetical protein H2200_011354 [Cladophialophora chaetospira]|uniref:AB hydrolase-1 domain-containing protein n=1 Tax=Cladophialophora chaetospira TaxID=386627 RepID=A0AA39CD20_9EURO|nr:hypothetical protein H2200_011354 [Cladophialophora chaetospira]